MDCPAVRDQLELFVLGDLPEPARAAVQAHLAVCADCRAVADQYRGLIAQIRQASEPIPLTVEFVRSLHRSVHRQVRAAAGRRRRYRLAAAAVAAVVAVGVGTWMLWPAADQRDFVGRPAVAVLWRQAGLGRMPAATAYGLEVHGPNVYVVRSSAQGFHVVALDGRTGRQRWAVPVSERGRLTSDDRRVYWLGRGPRDLLELVAFDGQTGRRVWRRSYQGPWARHLASAAPQALGDGRVGLTFGNWAVAFDGAAGRRLWMCTLVEAGLLSNPVAMGDAVYMADSRSLYCLAAESGRVRWRLPLGEPTRAGPRPLVAAGQGQVYAIQPTASGGGRVLAVGAGLRRLVWTAEVPWPQHVLVADQALYLRSGGVWALDGKTGSPLWTFPAEGCGALTCTDGQVCFVDSRFSGRLLAVEARTGRLTWAMPGLRSCEAFVTAGRCGYVKTQEGIVYALALGSGPTS